MPDGTARISEEERGLLRESVRGFLAENWPVEGAVERGVDPAAVTSIWRGLAAQGLARLGCDPDEGGLREILLVCEELGRASCPAPLMSAVLFNLLASREVAELRDALHRGSASLAIAFGAFDGDPAAGRAALTGGALTGRIAFVEGAASATHVLAFVDAPAGAVVVAADAPGVTIAATPGLAVPSLSEITFAGASGSLVAVPSARLAELAQIARLCCAARAVGAAQRGFELAVEHAKIRRQFGQFIGQFQAVQHKLADCLTRIDGSRLTLDAAATVFDRNAADWRIFAAAALAFAGPALRQVALEVHHTLGAIGYAEEHEMPRHFRRIHADVARFGAAPRARAELADYLLGPIAS